MRTIVNTSDGGKRYFICGKEVSEKRYLQGQGTRRRKVNVWKRGLVSEALAVHPDQIPEVMERNKRHGINVSYDSEGRPNLPTRGVRKALMKLEGHFDRAGGYGDA